MTWGSRVGASGETGETVVRAEIQMDKWINKVSLGREYCLAPWY